MPKYFLTLLLLFAVSAPAWGADALVNIPQDQLISRPPRNYSFEPGMTIVLPDGRRGIIEEFLPNGDFRTNLGQVISPEGIILSGPSQGEKIVIEEGNSPGTQITLPETVIPSEESPTVAETPEIAAIPGAEKPEIAAKKPENKADAQKPAIQELPVPKKPEQQAKLPAVVKKPQSEPGLTIAQMLPSTTVPDKDKPKSVEPTKAREAEKAKTSDPKKEKPKAAEPKNAKAHEKAKPEPKKREQAHAKQPEKKPVHEKARPGQELRIPPDAAAKGDLAFLEGCWQGTRPEYFSKRTIRECFCFGSNGSGKRRVIDPKGGRKCIGATRAHLSQDGVLSVTSSGAACTDGERWGSAEMVCRNSGPKTPCSWVFRDANNGRQAYTIPFIRVESCGR